jgi:subtilisin family serine protease
MGHNILSYQNLESNIAKSYGGNSTDTSAKAAVFNASYGVPACLFINKSIENTAYENVKKLRIVNGITKGGLIVKSAGNGFGNSQFCEDKLVPEVSNGNAAFDQANTVDNVIVVAAVNANGKKSSYSTTGANIWVSGIGGEYGLNAATLGIDLAQYSAEEIANNPAGQPAMITTDQSGCTKGYHTNKIKFATSDTLYSSNEFEKEGSTTQTSKNINCDYTSTFNGTSSAAPTVSGVIALMLEANSNLTWRDVKHILAMTAKIIKITTNDTIRMAITKLSVCFTKPI